MRYVIEHRVRVILAEPVRDYHAEVRLAPAPTAVQKVDAAVCITPEAPTRDFVDYFGNLVHTFSVAGPCREVTVQMRASVETRLRNPFDFTPIPPPRQREWVLAELRAHPPLWDYVLHRSAVTPDVRALDGPGHEWLTFDAAVPLLEQVQRAGAWIADAFGAWEDPAADGGPLDAVVSARRAGATDRAHLLIALVRSWGLAARYVVGHADPEYDASATPLHPWVDVLVPGAGWRGFDPTLQLIADDTFVAVAVGRDALDMQMWRAACGRQADAEGREHACAVRRVQGEGAQ